MITKVNSTGTQLQAKRTFPVSTIIGLLLALLGPTLVVVLSAYLQMGFIGGELFFWGTTLVILAIILFWERKPLTSIGFRGFTFKDAAQAAVFVVLVLFSFPLIYWLLSLLDVKIAAETIKAIGSLPVPVLVLLAVRAGVTEEILYRGFLIERLYTLTNSKFIAAALPLLVFILSHLSWGMAHLAFVTVAGALFTLLYFWKRNLWLNICCHFAVDIILFLVVPSWV